MINLSALKHHSLFMSSLFINRLLKKHVPLIVSITTTNRCNLKCIYCYGQYYDRDTKDFSKEELLKLIMDLKKMGTRLIHLEGGEPLIREDIGELIHFIKKQNMICRMNSNGLLLPKKVKELKEIDSLCISLDGEEFSNDKNRGPGTYKKIIHAIEVAKANGIPIATSSVLTGHNIDNGAIEHIASLAKKYQYGAQFNFLYEKSATTDRNDAALKVQEEKIRNAVKKLMEMKSNGYPIFYSFNSYQKILDWPFSFDVKKILSDHAPLAANDMAIQNPCYMGKYMCFIDGDGLVYPCGEHIGQFEALDFRKHGIKKAWEHIEQNKKCMTCYNTCFSEYNLLFDLNASVIWNNAKNFFRH
ncbi:MAG: radical SAM protein [Oligoflexia bacterium]|nr:radical SAM protein [Oligoflexia bacterium]